MRLPLLLIDRERDHRHRRNVGAGRVADGAADFGRPIGHHDRHVVDVVSAAQLDRLVSDVASCDRHGLQRPYAVAADAHVMLSGQEIQYGERAVRVGAAAGRVRTAAAASGAAGERQRILIRHIDAEAGVVGWRRRSGPAFNKICRRTFSRW